VTRLVIAPMLAALEDHRRGCRACTPWQTCRVAGEMLQALADVCAERLMPSVPALPRSPHKA